MPTLDVAMPTALLLVVLAALFLNKRVEGKLKSTVEEKEFKPRDIILLVMFIAIVISVIAYTSLLNVGDIFQNVLMIVFLSSYTMLLFTFSYIFSNTTKKRAQLFSLSFAIVAIVTGAVSLIGPLADGFTLFRVGSFFGLAVFCIIAIILEHKKIVPKERWYVAAQPPALFVLLFVFFNIAYGGAIQVWFPILMNVFGLTFAVLIILYLSSMFTWKTVGLFAILLTILDIILVFSGPMVTAAKTFTGLGLPVLVYLPNIPIIIPPADYTGITFFGLAPRGLGLGDFFFAGILAVQTFKQFGKKTAIAAVIGMVVAFGVWAAFLPEILTALEPLFGRSIGGFPGTLMIISGWIPVIAWKLLTSKKPDQISISK